MAFVVLQGSYWRCLCFVCPGVIKLDEFVSNAVFIADPTKDVHTQESMDRLVAVLGQIRERHAVVRDHTPGAQSLTATGQAHWARGRQHPPELSPAADNRLHVFALLAT